MLTVVVIVTLEDVRRVGQFWWRGYSDGSAYEELLYYMSLLLRPKAGRIRKDKHRSIAILIEKLTKKRTQAEAKQFLMSEDGKTWCKSQKIAIEQEHR